MSLPFSESTLTPLTALTSSPTCVRDDIDEGVLSLEQGPATPLIAALDSVLAGWEGKYVSDGKVVDDGEMKESWVVDDELARRLWEMDEELVGKKFL